jgi:hypothetical protein
MDVGLSGLRDIRIREEDYLLFILRDVPGRCVHLLGIVIKVDVSFIGCIGSKLIFWVFKRRWSCLSAYTTTEINDLR